MDHATLAAEFALDMADGMDWETLFTFVTDTLREKYELLSEEELRAEVREYAPHLLEDWDDDEEDEE